MRVLYVCSHVAASWRVVVSATVVTKLLLIQHQMPSKPSCKLQQGEASVFLDMMFVDGSEVSLS